MPYKSEKQRKYMNWAAEHGKIDKSVVNEFNQASKGMKNLPEHVKGSKFKKMHKALKGNK